MKRLIISTTMAAIGLIAIAAAPTMPVSFMDGPITYDGAGRITSITSMSGLPVAKFLYDPGTGPDGTLYSGIATLALDASGVPAMVNIYFVLNDAGLMTAFYFENPDDDTCCGMTTFSYTSDGYLCKAVNNTDESCSGRTLTIRYSEPIDGQRRMLYMVNTSSVGCPGGYFTVTPSSYPDNASINPAIAAAMSVYGLSTPTQIFAMAGFLGKAPATFPAAIYYTSSERSLSRQWLYEYEINPIDLPFRIDCNGSLWGSYGWK